MRTFKIFFGTISIIAVISILIVGVYASYFLGQYTLDDIKNHFLYNVDDISFSPEEEVDPNQLPTYEVQPGELLSNDQIVNILLVGSDARTNKERGRSDSMLIATIDMKHKKLKLTSFLRDTWVNLPGTDSKGKAYGWNRINTAYSYGDAKFLMETIEHNFNIKLDLYAVVNFELFRKVIDTIGGIELNISAKEAAYLRGRRLDEAGPNRGNMKEGRNVMDGWLALEFARARSGTAGPFTYTNDEGKTITASNDFARSARQRYVLETIFDKMKGEDLGTLVKIAEDCMKHTRTNIPLSELTKFISTVLSMGVDNISQMQIPHSGLYEDKRMTSGAQVLYISADNMEANARKIKEFIFEE